MRSEKLPPTPGTKHQSFLIDPRCTLETDTIAIVIDPGVHFEVPNDGLAIDDYYVLKPEDAMHGSLGPNLSERIAARSVIDLTVLDPKYEVMRRLLGRLEAGELPDRVFPDGRRTFHYGVGGAVRSITTPFSFTKRGLLLSPGPEIRNVTARRFVPEDKTLVTETAYKIVEDTVHRVAGKSVKSDKRAENTRINSINTIHHLGRITNAVLSEWSAKHEIPQITSRFEEPLEVAGQTIWVKSYVSTTDSDIVYGLDTFHAPHNGPGRRRAGLFNLLQVASMLENGQPAFTVDEAKLYANWLTKIKHERRIRRALAA